MTPEDAEKHLEQLEQRVLELEARNEIERLHASFVRAVADRRFDDLADYFVSDAVIDMRSHGAMSGCTAIAEHFVRMAEVPLEGASYILSSPVITVHGDGAIGVWTWHRFYSSAQVGGRDVTVWGVWDEGRYDCEYVRSVDGWRFQAMRFRIVRPVPDPEKETSV